MARGTLGLSHPSCKRY